MSQHYSNPERENEPTALPDLETCGAWALEPGWYYWHCFPGCLPDSDPVGPFESEEQALEDVGAHHLRRRSSDASNGTLCWVLLGIAVVMIFVVWVVR